MRPWAAPSWTRLYTGRLGCTASGRRALGSATCLAVAPVRREPPLEAGAQLFALIGKNVILEIWENQGSKKRIDLSKLHYLKKKRKQVSEFEL